LRLAEGTPAALVLNGVAVVVDSIVADFRRSWPHVHPPVVAVPPFLDLACEQERRAATWMPRGGCAVSVAIEIEVDTTLNALVDLTVTVVVDEVTALGIREVDLHGARVICGVVDAVVTAAAGSLRPTIAAVPVCVSVSVTVASTERQRVAVLIDVLVVAHLDASRIDSIVPVITVLTTALDGLETVAVEIRIVAGHARSLALGARRS